MFIEIGLLIGISLSAGIVDRFLPERIARVFWRPLFIVFLMGYSLFGQLDREAVRWLGQHLTLSFLTNYMSAPGDSLTWKIFSGDIFWTGVAGVLLALTIIPTAYTWLKGRQQSTYVGRRTLIAALLLCALLVTAHKWFRPSEMRWRRVRPATISIVYDAYRTLRSLDHPQNAALASSDLQRIVAGNVDLNRFPEDAPPPPDYPLWRDTNVGDLPPEAFRSLPKEQRPDIIFIVYETWRGWNTGLVPNPSFVEGNPQLNTILREQATYFPYAHSVGFPSVEGLIGLHLGLWSHPLKIFAADYLHLRTRALPEILRDAGYATYARVGADPSFDNFTSWLTRWYDKHEFNREIVHDEPLIDSLIERYEQMRGDDPLMMMLWTATTHPPYFLPDTEDVQAADDIEGRYVQTLHYSDKHVTRLIRYLQEQPDWDRTIVVMIGDHSQPTPEQWRYMNEIGGLSAGHTWTSLALLGGWPGLPEPGRFDFEVSQSDVAPTLLSMLNIRAYNHFMGRDLRASIADSKSDDTQEQERAKQRAIVALRYGNVIWQRDNERLAFRLDSDAVFHQTFDRADSVQYGQLDFEALQTARSLPENWPLERWQDAIRGYIELLDEDRLMPPEQLQ